MTHDIQKERIHKSTHMCHSRPFRKNSVVHPCTLIIVKIVCDIGRACLRIDLTTKTNFGLPNNYTSILPNKPGTQTSVEYCQLTETVKMSKSASRHYPTLATLVWFKVRAFAPALKLGEPTQTKQNATHANANTQNAKSQRQMNMQEKENGEMQVIK